MDTVVATNERNKSSSEKINYIREYGLFYFCHELCVHKAEYVLRVYDFTNAHEVHLLNNYVCCKNNVFSIPLTEFLNRVKLGSIIATSFFSDYNSEIFSILRNKNFKLKYADYRFESCANEYYVEQNAVVTKRAIKL